MSVHPKLNLTDRGFFIFTDLSLDVVNIVTKRVHNRFGGMQDLAYFEGGIRDAS